MIGLFAALLIMSFAIGWSALHPPGIEMKTDCIVMQDSPDFLQIPVMEQEEFTMLYSYSAPALHHDAGDIQSLTANNMVKNYQSAVYIHTFQTSFANTEQYDLIFSDSQQEAQSNNLKSFTRNTNEGLFRLDIGEIVLTI